MDIYPRQRFYYYSHPMIRLQLDQDWKWANFSPTEMACRHCGEIYYWPVFMNKLQAMRERMHKPLHILSAHRCSLHNARVGGAPFSQHLKLAADISLRGHEPHVLETAAKTQGFTGFGYYRTFLHIDLGRPRHWYGKAHNLQTLWRHTHG